MGSNINMPSSVISNSMKKDRKYGKEKKKKKKDKKKKKGKNNNDSNFDHKFDMLNSKVGALSQFGMDGDNEMEFFDTIQSTFGRNKSKSNFGSKRSIKRRKNSDSMSKSKSKSGLKPGGESNIKSGMTKAYSAIGMGKSVEKKDHHHNHNGRNTSNSRGKSASLIPDIPKGKKPGIGKVDFGSSKRSNNFSSSKYSNDLNKSSSRKNNFTHPSQRQIGQSADDPMPEPEEDIMMAPAGYNSAVDHNPNPYSKNSAPLNGNEMTFQSPKKPNGGLDRHKT